MLVTCEEHAGVSVRNMLVTCEEHAGYVWGTEEKIMFQVIGHV